MLHPSTLLWWHSITCRYAQRDQMWVVRSNVGGSVSHSKSMVESRNKFRDLCSTPILYLQNSPFSFSLLIPFHSLTQPCFTCKQSNKNQSCSIRNYNFSNHFKESPLYMNTFSSLFAFNWFFEVRQKFNLCLSRRFLNLHCLLRFYWFFYFMSFIFHCVRF